jgi:hypothetical protein
MSIVSRLFRGVVNIVETSTTPTGLECLRSYKIAATNEFYSSGFIIDKIDSVVSFDLIDLEKVNAENAESEMQKLDAFFKNSKYIHLGNLQTFSSLRLSYEYKTIQKDVKLVLDHKTNLLKSSLLDMFTPSVIAGTNEYDVILKNIFKYYEYFFVKSKAIVYRDNHIQDLFNSGLYLEFLSNLKIDKDEYFNLFNAFYATYNYGLSSFDAFDFLIFGRCYYQNEVGVDMDKLLDFKELDQSVIAAFKNCPNKIDEIQQIHNSSKEIGQVFKTYDELFKLIENYIRINAYSKYDEESLSFLDENLEVFMNKVRQNKLRVFCFYTLINISEIESSISYHQLKYCASEIAKINPVLIPNFKPG